MISIEEFKNKIKEHEDKNRNSIKEMYEFFVNFFNDLFTQCEDYFKISAEYLENDDVWLTIEKRIYLIVFTYKINDKFVYNASLRFTVDEISANYDYENKNMLFQSESYFNNNANYTLGEIFKNSISRKGNSKIFEELIEKLYEKVGERKVFTK